MGHIVKPSAIHTRRSQILASLDMLPCYLKSTGYPVARTHYEECKRQSRREKISGLKIMIPRSCGDRVSSDPGISRERSLTLIRFPLSARGSMDSFSSSGEMPCKLKIHLTIHTESSE